MRFKRGMIVELYDVTDCNVGLWAAKKHYPHLIGEIIDIECKRVFILFKDINKCAWFDKDMDIRPASKAAQVLYGTNK